MMCVVSQSKLGDVAQLRGDLAGALALQEAGLAVLRQFGGRVSRAVTMCGAIWGLRWTGWAICASWRVIRAVHLWCYNEAMALRQALLARLPERDDLLGDLAISLDKIGDVFLALDDPQAALLRFKAEVALLEKLVAQDAGQIKWQSDLAMGYAKLVNARAALGEPCAGGRALHQSAGGAADPDGAGPCEWWSGSAASPFAQSRLGDVALMPGDPVRAQGLLQQSYAIAQKLAARDPGNVETQMNLVASLVRIAIYDDDPKPRQREALAILKALQAEGRLDPGRADWIGLIEAQLAAP